MDFGRMPGSRRSKKKSGGFGGFGMRGQGGSPWRIERGSLAVGIARVAVSLIIAFRPALSHWLDLRPVETLRQLQLWRLVTSAFVNPTLGGLVFAGIGFWFIGSFLERAIGYRRLVVLFVVTATIGNLA